MESSLRRSSASHPIRARLLTLARSARLRPLPGATSTADYRGLDGRAVQRHGRHGGTRGQRVAADQIRFRALHPKQRPAGHQVRAPYPEGMRPAYMLVSSSGPKTVFHTVTQARRPKNGDRFRGSLSVDSPMEVRSMPVGVCSVVVVPPAAIFASR